MPDKDGRFVGQGWSRAREDAYVRIFGDAAAPNPRPTSLTTAQVRAQYAILPCSAGNEMCRKLGCVPAAPSPEVEDAR